ncbi:MAG: 1-acyl-sn-glycerol-3-phosphate acyltransferase [Rhizobiales bacterium]|nr:1-acyl-sn-glycerol-3-phosphate acyltransferase [Hyphomicrobiales bacterium]
MLVLVILRSAAFNVLFYLNLLVHFIIAIPTLVMPRVAIIRLTQSWGRTNNWLLRVAGIKIDYRGLEKIPPGALLVASKHQSLWETFGLLPVFPDPAFILKRELQWIPFFGWYAWKAGMIPVDRGRGAKALAEMTERTRAELLRGRQIVIFPEGTRRAPAAEPSYKFGIAHLYGETGITCLPIALNSGLFWPRRSFMRYPGTIVAEVLDPIPPGLSKAEFAARLQQEIETATARLVAEGEREPGISRQGPGSQKVAS